jgi:sarcosine oxidase subunit beta
MSAGVLVIGGGLIGSAIAHGLVTLGLKDVVVIDPDLSGEWSSSELNAGGVRGTWSQAVNLELSKASIDYFSMHADQVGYRACGYLWLHRPGTWDSALQAREMHVRQGWPVEVLDVEGIRRRVPFIDKTSDLAGGLFGTRDGLVNPNRLKEHFREEAIRGGARFIDGAYFLGAELPVSGRVRAEVFRFAGGLSSAQKKELLSRNPSTKDGFSGEQGQWVRMEADRVVNAAGAWAPEVARRLGYSCPSRPVRRQISLFHARDLDLTPYGMIIDPSGVYFHPEAVYGLSGYANPGESPGYRFDYDGDAFFEEWIWPALYERSSAFESLRHVSGWAGLYEESPDHHAIIGEAVAGGRIFEAHSFSGHGAMQSYAAGRGLAEKMVSGRYQTIDLSPLSATRFSNGKTIPGETWVI